jgi:hypothetical protein
MVAGAQPDSGGYLSPGIAGMMVGVSPEFDIYLHTLLRRAISSIQTLSLFFLHLPPPLQLFPFLRRGSRSLLPLLFFFIPVI